MSPERRRYEEAKRESVRVDVVVDHPMSQPVLSRTFRLYEIGNPFNEEIPWYQSAQSAAKIYVDTIMKEGVTVDGNGFSTRYAPHRIQSATITVEQVTEI